MIGGPYLHASLTTNFTQFGEGKLFGKADWDRDVLRPIRPTLPARRPSYAGVRMRGGSAGRIPTWFEILEDDGTVLIGRVVGF